MSVFISVECLLSKIIRILFLFCVNGLAACLYIMRIMFVACIQECWFFLNDDLISGRRRRMLL